MNLSYCRFQNTLGDLRDCARYIDEPVSADESEARRKLIGEAYDLLVDNNLLTSDGELDTKAIDELPEEAEDEDEDDEG
jgi:hypothetical protein